MIDGGSESEPDFHSTVRLAQAGGVVFVERSQSPPEHPSPDLQRPRKTRPLTLPPLAAKTPQAPPDRRAKADAAVRHVRRSPRARPGCPENRSRSHHLQIDLPSLRT